MLRIFFVFLSFHLVLGGRAVNEDLPRPPRFSLNLDLPEEERWKPILSHWNAAEYKNLIKPFFGFLTNETRFLLDIVGAAIENFLPSPYAGEIRGIAEQVQMKIGDVVFMNILYDVSVSCTSIVAQDSQGNIWHGRNLDYDFPAVLRNLTVDVDFQSKGKTLYTTTVFAGQTGMFTGQRPNAFTISLNQRDKGTIAEDIIQVLKALISDKTVFTTFQIRNAIAGTDTATYELALQRLAYKPQTAPNYFIIGGSKATEGAVVTRDRLKSLDVWRLDASHGRWYLLETNYDHWVPPPKSDDRRDAGMKAMNETGQDAISLNTLLKVLSVPLVCNPTTVYTTLMSAAHPASYATFIRHCD